MEKQSLKKYMIFYSFIALFSAACASCYANGTLFLEKSDVLFFVLKIILFFLMYVCAHLGYSKLRGYFNNASPKKLLFNRLTLTFDKDSIKKMMMVLLLAWLPYLIIFYPGVSNYDTANQINDYYNGTAPMSFMFVEGKEEISFFLNDHHPITSTLIMVPFVALGRLIGYTNFGMVLYVVVQMIFTAFSFSLMIGLMERISCSYALRKLCFLFLAVMPFIPMHAICMLKDCIYASIFVLYMTYYVAILKRIQIGRHTTVVFITISLFLSLTKKTGIYLVFICNLALLVYVFFRKTGGSENRKTLTGIVLSILVPFVVISVIFSLILFPLANIYPGGKQEMLGTLFQQTAKVIVDSGDDALRAEEQESFGKLVDVENIESLYNSVTTDPVKATYNMHATSKDISEYLIAWAKVGLRHPIKYLEATLAVSGGFFSPKKEIDIFDGIPVTSGDEMFSEFSNPASFSGFRKAVNNIYYLF